MPTIDELKLSYDGIKSQIDLLLAQKSGFPKSFKRELITKDNYKIIVELVELGGVVAPTIKIFAPNGTEIAMPDISSGVISDWAKAKKKFEDWLAGAPDIVL